MMAVKCAALDAPTVVCALTEEKNRMGEDNLNIFRRAVTEPDALKDLLDALLALQAVSNAPGSTNQFSVHANRLTTYAAAVCGGIMTTAAGPLRSNRDGDIRFLSCASFNQLVQVALNGWVGLVRRSSAAGLNSLPVSAEQHMPALFLLFDICSRVTRNGRRIFSRLNSENALEAAEVEQFKSMPVAPLVSVVRCFAEMAASMPAALNLAKHPAVMAFATHIAIRSELHLTGARCASAARSLLIFSRSAQESAPIDASAREEVEQAAHACLHAALTLHKAGPPPLEPQVSSDAAVASWFQTALILMSQLESTSEAAARVALHVLAAVAAIPESVLQEAFKSDAFEAFCKGLASLTDVLGPVVVPEDVAGLERVERSSSLAPADAAKLQQLSAAASDAESVKERQRRRLELLSRLPAGVCANLRCAESVPADGRFKICSGCRSARYCGPSCLR